ncbi:tyrosine-type recombinase/integrase [Bradyrhizobium sp. F1.13.3]|uniref:tyrosine-type recombinase/integrase n=1 Tax=Bradyrhizobium sp. F1.13.3 TaxID=3156351 RepID=UPI003396DEF2
MGRKRKAPAGMQWRGKTLYSEFQIKGVAIRRSLKTDDPGIAQERLKELKREINSEAYGGGGPRFMIDVIADWKAFMKGNSDERKWRGKIGKETFDRYCCSLIQIADYLEGKKLSQINKALIGQIVDGRGREVTTATIKRDLGALSSVMQYACDRDWCESNPALPWLKRLKERRDPIVEPRNEDIALMIERSRGMWPYIIEAARRTGVREDALISLKRDAVSDRGELKVVDKGNKFRVIDLSEDDIRFFASIPAFIGKEWLFWRTTDKRVRKDSNRKPTFRGDCIEDPAAEFKREMHRVAAWAAANGVEFRHFAFHHLRHKFAIEYMRNGGYIYDLQKILGHSTVRQTEEYLKYLTPEQQLVATHGVSAAGHRTQRAAS